MKTFIIKLCFTAASLLMILLMSEIGYRVIEYISDEMHPSGETWAVYDKDLLYRPRPDYKDHNSDGLRDDDIASVKSGFRILMLGDSIAYYGDDINDTYVGYLEHMLNNNSELVPAEVINAGLKGYTTFQERIYLEKFGVKFKPDLVGIGFCLNDLHKYLHAFKVKDGKIIGQNYYFTAEAVRSVGNPVYQFLHQSHFLVWLRRKLSVFDHIVEAKMQKEYTFNLRPDFNTAWKDESWQLIEDQLDEIVQTGKKNGFRVFLVAFPFGEQLRNDYLNRDFNYVTKPQRKLREICQKLNIPFLDLFYDLERGEHFIDDGIHLSKEGRRAAAYQIAAFLEEEHLVPRRSEVDSFQ
jgi:lysophospholipase L1-like esterase